MLADSRLFIEDIVICLQKKKNTKRSVPAKKKKMRSILELLSNIDITCQKSTLLINVSSPSIKFPLTKQDVAAPTLSFPKRSVFIPMHKKIVC